MKAGPSWGRSSSIPSTTSMASADGSGGLRRDEDLVRAEASRGTRCDRDEHAVRPDESVVVGWAGQAARRTDELALGDGNQFIRVQDNDRERIEARVDREENVLQP